MYVYEDKPAAAHYPNDWCRSCPPLLIGVGSTNSMGVSEELQRPGEMTLSSSSAVGTVSSLTEDQEIATSPAQISTGLVENLAE